MSISIEQHRAACSIDLYAWLLEHHPGQVKQKYGSVLLLDDLNVSVKKGYHGFLNWKTNEKGNNIDYLCNYLGYQYPDAVRALTNGLIVQIPKQEATQPRIEVDEKKLVIPVPEPGPYKRLYAFLSGRGIPIEVIRELIERKLLYQDAAHGNIIFINPENDYYEVRGTNTYADKRCRNRCDCERYASGQHQWCSRQEECCNYRPSPYHGSSKEIGNRFWYYDTHPDLRSEVVYITEAAIDAISLYCIHQKQGLRKPAVYVSIGGVSKQGKIDRLKLSGRAVLAVDNDAAGEACRQRNSDLPAIIPKNKDWNDDLRKEIYYEK